MKQKKSTAPHDSAQIKLGSIRALKALNFFVADVQNGMGPYVTLFLQSSVQWNPAQIGTVLAAGNIAQVLAQTPAGVLIDRLHRKRELILAGIFTVTFTTVPVVALAQTLVGIAGAIFPPCLASIALGLVGRARMDRQMGINQAFNAAGNLTAALVLGAIGYYLGLKWMFYLVVVFCFAAAASVLSIEAGEIDFNLACGADGESTRQRKTPKKAESLGSGLADLGRSLGELLRQKPVAIFLVCAVLFHFANAVMVPLVTEMLGKNQGSKSAVLYTSGYMLASQLVFVVVASFSGRLAARIGR